jgi:arabinofuranosyltransferase
MASGGTRSIVTLLAPRLRALSGELARRHVASVLYVSALIYAGVSLWCYPRWNVDDAYIVFRYARNLVEHGQLTWNVGADPVEGYTGIALPLLVAGGMRIGVAPQSMGRVVGVASFFLAAWTLRDNQRRLGVPEPVRAYVTATALLFPPLFAHATGGLETMLFAAILGASFGALLSCDASPRPSAQAVLWVELLLLCVVRPEGLLFAAVFGSALAFRLRHAPLESKAAPGIAVAVFAIPYGAYFAWRATYYGRLFPNTYYAKKLASGFDDGFVRTTATLLDAFLPLLVAGLAVTILARRLRVPRPPVFAALVALLLLGVQYSRSTLIMGYFFRFQVHGLFIALPLLGVLLGNTAQWAQIHRRCGAAKGAVLAALVATCLVAWPIEAIAAAADVRAHARRYLEIESEEHARVGAWLRDHLPPSESIACWVDAGLIPFTADAHAVIDFGRLNDEYLAHDGRSREDIATYFFSRSPGALVITSDSPTGLAPQHDGAIVTTDPRFDAYEFKEAFCSPEYRRAPCEVLFLRRGVRPL